MFTSTLIPTNEPERLAALAPYRILGSHPDVVFDEIVRLTAKLFDVPIALVSLVDKDSVLFKATFGLGGAQQVARDESLCSVAILQQEATIYGDLQAEPCSLTKPGVAEALQMRFYAGHPLCSEQGYNIGALCVIDRQPRQLSSTEQQRLADLANVVMQLLTLRLALQQRANQTVDVWIKLYEHLDVSLTRLDTLAELSRWEDSPTTPNALRYQQAREEEAALVITKLAQQVSKALAALAYSPVA